MRAAIAMDTLDFTFAPADLQFDAPRVELTEGRI